MAQQPKLGRVIARRELGERYRPKTRVVVSIGMPRKDPRHDWACPFQIEGIADSKVQLSYGVDAMQALIIAIQGVRATLLHTGRKLFWIGPKMDSGFPILVHTHFGKEFEDRVGLAIERETVRAWRNIIETRRARLRAHEAKLRRRGLARAEIARSVAPGKQHLDEWESRLNRLKPGWNRIQPKGETRSKQRVR